jgi:hypothetical protein
MAIEKPSKPIQVFREPPCESSFLIHYRDGEPVGLAIDGKGYSVRRLRTGTRVLDGDKVLVLVETLR